MTAFTFVVSALVATVAAVLLLAAPRWHIAALFALALALVAVVAEGARAAAELCGERLPGVVAATRETLRLESVRASGQRSSQYNPKHRFGAIVCYRAAAAPGQGVLRQAEVQLDEANHDALRAGQAVMLHVLRPLGRLDWAWTTDAPLLPWLAGPHWGGGAAIPVQADVIRRG